MTRIVKHNVPFYTQIFPHDQGTFDGFDSIEEMKCWERKACGAVCLKMIIEYFLNKKVSIGAIVKKGIELSAYSENGWTHVGIVAIANFFGLSGINFQDVKIDDIFNNISVNRICIASVFPRFQNTAKETKKSGHLILIIGFEKTDKQNYFIIHHPSYEEIYNWNEKKITEKELINNFSGNIILIWK